VSPVDPTTLPGSAVREALVAGARGLYRDEVAVQLLLDHDVWPHRADFLQQCVQVDDAGWTCDGTDTLAGIDWDAARELAASSTASGSEMAVLELAVGLAEGTLGGLVIGLDPMNLWLFLDAVAHTAGWHERGITRLVTGGVR